MNDRRIPNAEWNEVDEKSGMIKRDKKQTFKSVPVQYTELSFRPVHLLVSDYQGMTPSGARHRRRGRTLPGFASLGPALALAPNGQLRERDQTLQAPHAPPFIRTCVSSLALEQDPARLKAAPLFRYL